MNVTIAGFDIKRIVVRFADARIKIDKGKKYAKPNQKKEKTFSEDVFISKNKQSDEFYYAWDLAPLNVQPGDNIEYYFEVWDNDGVNGSKATRSEKKLYKAPTLKYL